MSTISGQPEMPSAAPKKRLIAAAGGAERVDGVRQWCVLGQGQGGVVTDDVDPVSRADSGLVEPVGAGACGTGQPRTVPAGCAGPWPGCRCPARPADWSWRWT